MVVYRANSLINTAIEYNVEHDLIRQQIVRDLENSLYRLSHQSSDDRAENKEHIIEDQWSHLRRLEEIQVIKSIDKLSVLYPDLWQNAINNSVDVNSLENFEIDLSELTKKFLLRNRLPINLRNWRERIKEERVENCQLLQQLYARKEKLQREREQVNRMVNIITQIFDNNHTGHESTTYALTSPSANVKAPLAEMTPATKLAAKISRTKNN